MSFGWGLACSSTRSYLDADFQRLVRMARSPAAQAKSRALGGLRLGGAIGIVIEIPSSNERRQTIALCKYHVDMRHQRQLHKGSNMITEAEMIDKMFQHSRSGVEVSSIAGLSWSVHVKHLWRKGSPRRQLQL